MKTALIIPTLNAGPSWSCNLDSFLMQDGVETEDILIIDSSSVDDTVSIAQSRGVHCITITRESFSHGGTRNQAALMFSDYDIMIFLTQDVTLPSRTSISELIKPFLHDQTAVSFGRQIPRNDASVLEVHARSFNYPEHSYISQPVNAPSLGIRAVFSSNAFCAYRNSTFKSLSGFSEKVILSEDMEFAARALINGHSIHYTSCATAMHSHALSFRNEFTRYFDIGVFHRDNSWIHAHFGGSRREGLKYAKSLITHLCKTKPLLLPIAILHIANKWIAYQLGMRHESIPLELSRKISTATSYWTSRTPKA